MFKKIVFFTLFCTFGFASNFDYKLKPQKVSENIWCFFGKTEVPSKENGGFMANSCYIKAKDSYILIDTGANYNFAKQAYEAMQKIEDLKVSTIIITHEHDDHWMGNSFYKDRFNSTIYAPKSINENYNENSKPRIFEILDKNEMENTKVIKADVVVSDEKVINISDKTIKIIPTKLTAHTKDDLIVYLPDEKVIFTGDIIMNQRVTSNRDGSVIGTLKAIDLINSYDWNTLIAGHGTITDKKATDFTTKYFTLLKTRVLEAIEAGITADEISKVVTMDDFKDIAMFDELNSRNVFDAFRELEFYDEE
ncbi:MBL fold metallo-hydrolase [Aliarcobacter cryaerophilus]|mgnify:FL=1|jgi:glyoxylase-like metal-dependent hydrolase (beta-lactamase superfamily II)|uniref:MBL fold metallo-hydrolase n=1 Tax=Aliarcobacter cryaerophilus TaxID=28198 RepID=UPI0008324331|nr:MBL fold metallo-hydrolase [Aliarcobacter cryaerophilus]MCT7485420.1 MBL fold metallo-hydrolase [Aliarcobacter cryaerophilus]MCT7491261.1 MBL fold metallo-hydrolase [Aliarcobacter cryaerophilus]MCT7497407.1 MBL fold metallo-hydrolase [Aliarcobacter cryaerophilus]QNM88853.1 MBL fold metallo-hydrolase [Aliarcobacter cryaerophilus]HRM34773.1 MBL fold metallo-hydrolase [Aliarcobacter cryaerophilus]